MANQKSNTDFIATIGIECHVQLNTKTKLFSGVDNNARNAAPNTLISHIDFGMPGALPVLNEEVVNSAIKVAFAFGVSPQKISYFERKHYFYPDLPKGYQITQLSHPIIKGGGVDILVDGEVRTVHLDRVQIEEDAGKSTHPAGAEHSLVDLNRAGTPLLEIVSLPEMHSSAEAKAYARELWLIMRYLGVSDADMYHGNMRFDVNVSISRSKSSLGVRTETKNLNSFRSVEKAVEYEIARQIEIISNGHEVIQETRGWDDSKQKTFSQRGKEEAHDYRYFPEPDIPPLELDENRVTRLKKAMPSLPTVFRKKFSTLKLDSASVETIIDSPSSANFISTMIDNYGVDHARRVANWIVNSTPNSIEDQNTNLGPGKASLESAADLSKLVSDNKLSSSAAKEVWSELFLYGGDPLNIAKTKNLLQLSGEDELVNIIDKVLSDNPQAAADVLNGEMKAIGFLVGQVMKESKGKANPSLTQELIKKRLSAN